MKFLNKIVSDLINKNPDLSGFTFVLPGKRPIVFIKKILEEKKYTGFLPQFYTIEELIEKISKKQLIKGVGLWLMSYEVYRKLPIHPNDDFSDFLKWFPTLVKDWDDVLKFTEDDSAVLEFMFDEERIKVWAQNLEDDENKPRKKFLNFWKNMSVFLPKLKEEFSLRNFATAGMVHESVRDKLDSFCKETSEIFVFCGFNAFTPVEEKLIKKLLKWGKAEIYFQGDEYYVEDEKQEAGQFLRQCKKWSIFNDSRSFNWIEEDFKKPKNIKVFEVSGNITQSKLVPKIISQIKDGQENVLENTAIVLLDENLLPTLLDSLSEEHLLNITMGFPLKNLSFSNAIKHIFHLHKQLEKKKNTYYYKDILAIVEELPNNKKDLEIISGFKSLLEERNLVYISAKVLNEKLGDLSYYKLFEKPSSLLSFLESLSDFCFALKFNTLDDVQYETISHFEKTFKVIGNQISAYSYEVKMETLEVLIQQALSSETIDFRGEPLHGIQVMGLLETRLLNFKNLILLSVNEGKLPLGNTQNTYIPFDVRKNFGLHTFLENDGIYAYHFYRLLQSSENVYLMYNALSSGVNTGEKSRFITQLEFEDKHHNIQHFVVENHTESVDQQPITIVKTKSILDKLEIWKEKVSATHLTSYLYNPVDFYLNKILEATTSNEIEEELSVKNYGNLVHYALQIFYEDRKGRYLTVQDLEINEKSLDDVIAKAIEQLNHQPEFYDTGLNYIHKSIAKRVVEKCIEYDLNLLRKGHSLKILDLERKFENIELRLDESDQEKVFLYGFIDRMDELDGTLRIIDYKTAKTKKLSLKIDEGNVEDLFLDNEKKQALQLCMYEYVASKIPEFSKRKVQTAIWSFAEIDKGPVVLEYLSGDNGDAMVSIKNLILEILDPEIPFVEKTMPKFNT